MAAEEQLEWERRVGRPAGIAATLAAALLLLGLLYPVLIGAEVELRAFERYLASNEDPSLAIVPAVLQTLGYLAFGFALYYLARATRARRPEMLRAAIPMAIIGPLLSAIGAIALLIMTLSVASAIADIELPTRFAGGAPELAGAQLDAELATLDERDDNAAYRVVQILDPAANLALGFALVIIALNAMRAGLLSRFMGILGIIVGVLTVLFQGAGIIEAFWLAALGTLFLDRWPNGRGPAWETGEATPWPTAADMRAEEEDGAEPEAEAGLEPEDAGDQDEAPAAEPQPASRKRKKKKRR